MKKTPHQRGVAGFFNTLFDRHQKLFGTLSSAFGIATGVAWIGSFLPAAPTWAWPAVATLAAVALAIALYRGTQLSRRLDEDRKALNDFIRAAWAQHIETLKDVFADAQAGGDISVTHLAALATTLRQYKGNTEGPDPLLGLIHEYEQLRFQKTGD